MARNTRFDVLARDPSAQPITPVIFSTSDVCLVERLSLLGFFVYDRKLGQFIEAIVPALSPMGQAALSAVLQRDPRDRVRAQG